MMGFALPIVFLRVICASSANQRAGFAAFIRDRGLFRAPCLTHFARSLPASFDDVLEVNSSAFPVNVTVIPRGIECWRDDDKGILVLTEHLDQVRRVKSTDNDDGLVLLVFREAVGDVPHKGEPSVVSHFVEPFRSFHGLKQERNVVDAVIG
jgi:hypothetical protein